MLAQISPARSLALRPRGLWPLFLALLLLTAAVLAYIGITATRTAVQTITAPDLGKLPLSFELNVGQTSSEVQYMSRASGGNFFFTTYEVVLSLAGADDATGVLRTSFVGANAQAGLSAGASAEGKANYLIGNDPSNWHTDVPTFAGINYTQLYSGIDLAYSGTEGLLKSTYTVAPGADPASIRWRYTGTNSKSVDASGNLQLSILSNSGKALTVTEETPVSWQTINGQNVAVSAQFKIFTDGTIGFVLGSYNEALPLVIDPTLIYSTYLGGSGFEYGAGVRTDAEGNMYIGGQTASANFPITNSLQPTYGGGTLDAFVAKFNPAGTALIYSTFLGGSNMDGATDIQLNDADEAYLIGFTASASFPISNAIQPVLGGSHDAFVSKLNASGSGLVFSTFIGGGGLDEATRSGLDSDDNIYLAGFTQSSDFPIHNAYQQSLLGIQDAFLVKMPANGSALIYSTYFGGGSADAGYGAAVDSQGNAYVSGYTLSANLPVLNAYQAIYGGGGDAFVAKFNTNGASLLYSTYIGGSDNDVGEGIYVDALGNAHVTGSTASSDFPTTNAFQSTKSGGDDAFVTKLAANGSSLIYSTFM
ncbi:MAG: SBBP repeat-containing protein, partial [Chloroflexia bacterium]